MNFIKKIISIIYSCEYDFKDYRSHGGHKIIKILGLKFKFKIDNKEIFDKSKKINNCVAIISADGIGDYMYMRQFFKYIRQSAKYKNSKLILFEQPNHYNYARVYDSEYFDDIILYTKDLIHLEKGIKGILKRYDFISCINLNGTKISKQFAKLIKADEKYIEIVDYNIDINKSAKNNDYNCAIYMPAGVPQLDRKRLFFQKLLDLEIPKQKLSINPIFDFRDKYITISLMAMAKKRCYSDEKWMIVIKYIIDNTPEDLKLLFIGSELDRLDTQRIIDSLNNNRCINMCGLMDSSIIPCILANTEFLIAPETGTVHIASAIDCKTICLCSGSNYGRMLPHENIHYVFPRGFQKILNDNDIETLKKYYNSYSEFNTSDVDTDDVIVEINKLLKVTV